ncbi:hypothetical protein HZI73_13430 [Vallitalea pronyensis]|uniref:Magnesium transporter MgtE intracellular domain-containing protein n=1 Tax=Vallitalea pronyensis TaxID=1348613 RepID=A0A8J8MKB9_9FIRM|nr:hypothetical protein [Vallitalea pronyensis]QUI23229.1 hypothetical protein HZI73_13430 [Vallitalea pronyensis]
MENETIELQEKGSALSIVIGIIISALVLLGALIAVIRLDIAGFGTQYAYPLLKDIPVLNIILPEVVVEAGTDAENQDTAYAFETVDEAVERLKVTETLLKDKEVQAIDLQEQIKLLEAENARLKVFEENQLLFDERKKEFDEMVVLGKGVPDISNFRTFYEEIKPDNAAEIYGEVIKKEAYNQEIVDIAQVYQSMKPASAAAILMKMTTTSSKMKMVVQILDHIDSEQQGAILSAMETKTAAKITEYLFPKEE